MKKASKLIKTNLIVNQLSNYKLIKAKPSNKEYKEIDSLPVFTISLYDKYSNEEIYSIFIQGNKYISISNNSIVFERYKLFEKKLDDNFFDMIKK
ncbi:hypothetical protein [Faecalimicrobium sp. JNUCC 81]